MPGKNVDFDNLDLLLLVIGEIEVIKSRDISESEQKCRLNILSDIHCNAGFYEWQADKRLFTTIISEVEKGIRNWDDNISQLEWQILMIFPLWIPLNVEEVNQKPKVVNGQKKKI